MDDHVDVLVIGGGPAGSVAASLLAADGRRVLVIERDIHPRDHVGESLTPASNAIWHQIGFRQKMEEAGFVHKPGAAWTAPRSPVGRRVLIRLNELPLPGALPPYHTYNVERDVLDSMLLRHAHEQGARVLQGVRVNRVLFENGRAVGVHAKVDDGWERDIRAKVVVDASGRKCQLAGQLGLKRKDPGFNQFAAYSWYTGLEPNPPGTEGMIYLHFVGIEKAWVWAIPLRNGITSVGVVTDKDDFKASGQDTEEWFDLIVARNATLRHVMRDARRIRPFRIEGDYSYKLDRLAGPGWLLVGDAVRFVDPIFSTGIDVAAFSALFAYHTITATLNGGDEEREFTAYQYRVTNGIDVWYDLISLFYQLQNIFTFFALKQSTRETVIRILQGNPYSPDTLPRARAMLDLMERSRVAVANHPGHLFAEGKLTVPALADVGR